MNLTERTIIAGAVILTIRNAATDAGVHFLTMFFHHNTFSSFERYKQYMQNVRRLLTFFKFSCTIVLEEIENELRED